MGKELLLFEKSLISFKERFIVLMNQLVSNQSIDRTESIIFMSISYIQILSGFYSTCVGVLNPDESVSDMIVNYIFKIFRYRDLLYNYPTAFFISIYVVAGLYVLFLLYFFIVLSKTTKESVYSAKEIIINFCLKILIYILFNIILDMSFGQLCFEDKNIHFNNLSCTIMDHFIPFAIGLILAIMACVFHIFIQFFYIDSLFLSTSYYAKISCNYELFFSINSVIFALILNLVQNVTKEIFFLYNLVVSMILFRFYIMKLIYYDNISNKLCGVFHLLYVWSSIFFGIFAYIDVKEKGFIFIVSCVIVCFIFLNVRSRLDESIFMSNPYYKIMNKEYLLYYLKTIIEKINKSDESPDDRAILTGIIQLHIIECPNPNCITKNKNKLYLPITNEWSDRTKPCFLDKVFLKIFIIAIIHYFISLNFFSPEMIINISLYYLQVIGNYCQALYFYQKVKEMKLTTQENFSFLRLKAAITYTLTSKLRPCNQPCYNLDDMNVTYFFAYEELAKQFHDEVNHDIQLSLEFWRTFAKGESRQVIDFNKVFKITDQIRIAKSNVEKIWDKIFKLYSGVNDLFLFYLDYVEQINDDDQLKRDLEGIKRKNEISTENIQQNYYNLLFSNETGIIIVNGDRGKEDLIEKVNPECEKLFKYNPDELIGMNLSNLMPKMLHNEHKGFIQKYFEIGEKKVIEKKGHKTFAKDKDNAIILVKLGIKLFPIVNESVYFIGMINAEKVDDIILIDHLFNIQGMSQKLSERLSFENKNFFMDYDIPFYLICKKFVNFYKIFLQGKKKEKNQLLKKNTNEPESTIINNPDEITVNENGTNIKESVINNDIILNNLTNINNNGANSPTNNINLNSINNNDDNNNNDNDTNNDKADQENHDNIEINENIELEYEIKVPAFLIDYSNQIEKRENKTMEATHISSGRHNTLNSNESMEEEEESLMSESSKSPREKRPSKNNRNSNNNQNENSSTNEANITGGKKSNEEKEFLNKINKHRKLFEEGEFAKLEDLIDKNTSDSSTYEFKFNFTFEKYQFGDKRVAYIIRCIDNKNDIGILQSDDESEQFEANPKIIQCKKEKIEELKPLIEMDYEEKEELSDNILNFMKYSFEDYDFQTCLIKGKEDIKKLSRVHGQKKEEAIIDDENSSQSSQAGYDSNLCKINRIEEIRGNLIRNVSSFHTLKWIKLVSILFLAVSIVFSGLFYYLFKYITFDIKQVSEIHGKYYLLAMQLAQLTSTFISLRGVYYIDTEKMNVSLNSFTSDKAEYFRVLKNSSEKWYDNALLMAGVLKKETVKYVPKIEERLWNQLVMNYTVELPFKDTESFPIAVDQTLINMHNLLNNPLFNVKTVTKTISTNTNTDTIVDGEGGVGGTEGGAEGGKSAPNESDILEDLHYSAYMSIENSHDVLLPNFLSNLGYLLSIFIEYNNGKIRYLYIIIFCYLALVAILSSCMLILLIETDKNMGEGFEKITKISPDKIDDIIKKLETFQNLWKKKDRKLVVTNEADGLNEMKQTTQSINPSSSQSRQMIDFSEGKLNKKLTIITSFYAQAPLVFLLELGFLLPLLLVTKEVINNNVDILSIQGFFLGRFLLAGSSTVAVKCLFSRCQTNTTFDYYSFLNIGLVTKLYGGLRKYKKFNDFYSSSYLLNACSAAFDDVTDEYAECMKSPLIRSLNNTDSLLKLISDDVNYLVNEFLTGSITALPGKFNPLSLYNSTTFNDLETAFYKYIIPVPLRFDKVLIDSFDENVKYYSIVVICIICGLGLFLWIYTIYTQCCFLNQLIHLLSVSRCIVKIIPTNVITTTQELENWIEKMNIKVN